MMPLCEAQRQIENALRALPNLRDGMETKIPLFAEHLVLAAGYKYRQPIPPNSSRMKGAHSHKSDVNRPRTVPTTIRETVKEVELITTLAKDMIYALETMHATTAAAIGYPELGDNNNLEMQLRHFLAKIEYVDNDIWKDMCVEDCVTRPANTRSWRAATTTAYIYWHLTGKKPPRRASARRNNPGGSAGPFNNLLSLVLTALGITADLDNLCRRMAEDWEEAPWQGTGETL